MRHSTFEPVRLDAYRVARELLVSVARCTRTWAGWSDLADQCRRAATSVLLNIAEGAGQPIGSRNKHRHFAIAHCSALEVAATLDAATVLGLEVGDAPPLAARAVQLTAGLVRRHR